MMRFRLDDLAESLLVTILVVNDNVLEESVADVVVPFSGVDGAVEGESKRAVVEHLLVGARQVVVHLVVVVVIVLVFGWVHDEEHGELLTVGLSAGDLHTFWPSAVVLVSLADEELG